jgi:hypothetical protein
MKRYKRYQEHPQDSVMAQTGRALLLGEELSVNETMAKYGGSPSIVGLVIRELRSLGFQTALEDHRYKVVGFPPDWDDPQDIPLKLPPPTKRMVRIMPKPKPKPKLKPIPVPLNFYPMLGSTMTVKALLMDEHGDVGMSLTDSHGAVWQVRLLND